MKKALFVTFVAVFFSLLLVSCGKDKTTEPEKVATLEFVEASIEVLDVDIFQYQISFTLKNTGNATATNIQGKLGVKFEGENEITWMDEWIPLDFDLSAGSTYTENYVDNADDADEFNELMNSDIYFQFKWDTKQ